MAAPSRSGLCTVEDYLLTPDGGPRYQLIDGHLYQMASPNRLHQEILIALSSLLWKHLRENPIGKVYSSPLDVFLDDINVFQPDIAVVLTGRYGILSDRGLEGGPDLVVEVLSPSTSRFDLGPKRRVYAGHGVSEYWVIDPDTATVAVYRGDVSAPEPTATLGRSAVLSTPLLPGWELPLSEIFPA